MIWTEIIVTPSSPHKPCCCWFSVQFLCNFIYLKFFSPFSLKWVLRQFLLFPIFFKRHNCQIKLRFRSANSSFVLQLSSFPQFFKDTMPRNVKLSASRITLFAQNTFLWSSNVLYLVFFVHSNKKRRGMMFFVTGCYCQSS